MFIKVDNYNDVLDTLKNIKSKLKDAQHKIKHIEELRNQEEEKISLWKSTIDTLDKNLEEIDQQLFNQ